jgi:hypothetical protein
MVTVVMMVAGQFGSGGHGGDTELQTFGQEWTSIGHANA